MKHRFSFAVAYLCVLALFTLGVWELVFAPKESTLSELNDFFWAFYSFNNVLN